MIHLVFQVIESILSYADNEYYEVAIIEYSYSTTGVCH